MTRKAMTASESAIRRSATCSIEELRALCAEVSRALDEMPRIVTRRNVQAIMRLTQLSRVLDGIGELRFGEAWLAISPAREADRKAGLA